MTKKHKFKVGMSLCLVGSMLLTTPNMKVLAVEPQGTFSDIKGHWASDAIERMSSYKLVNGYNGLFRPSDPITRGEMSIIIDHVMDYQNSSANIFSDLEEAFYTDAVLKAYEADLLFETNGLVRPKDNITRQEVAFMIYNAFDIEPSKETSNFLDADQVATWATESVNALAAKGIIQGSEGKFRPNAPITRAEAVTILNRLLAGYYNTSGTYTGEVNGTAVISAADANLKDVVVKGDLIIAEGVAEGDVVLDNVIVEGRTIIRGGGVNSIKVEGNSKLNDVVMAKEGPAVRLAVSDSAAVSHVTVDKESKDVVVAGNIGTVKLEAKGASLTVQDGRIEAVEVAAENAKVDVKGKADIRKLDISDKATDTKIDVDKNAKLRTVNAEAKATISGTGTVDKVNANANDIVVKTTGTEVTAAKGTTGVMAGKEPVKGGSSSSTSNTGSSGSSNSSDDSDDSSSSNKPQKQELAITKVESVQNGLVRVTLNRPSDKVLTKDQFSIICTGAGRDMTVLSVSTKDNKVYDLTTSYFDDNTYSLGILLEGGKLIEKDFVSKYDCPEISSAKMTRVDDTSAKFSFVSDAPGTLYYGIGKEVVARSTFGEEPTAEELMANGTKVDMKLHLNEIKIDSLAANTPYTLYYVAVDTEGKVTPVKSINIAAEPTKGPELSDITIESAKGFEIEGADLGDEMAGFNITLSEATQERLTLEQFEITCPTESNLTLGRVETDDNKTYTVYMKPNYMFKSGNTYTVTIRFKDNTVATKDFFGDVQAPIISGVDIVATTGSAIRVEFNSNEGGTIYYKVLEWDDEIHGTTKPKDPAEIYASGTSQKIDYGFNRIEGVMAKEGQAFCYVTEDALGNRTRTYYYGKVPAYVPEPEAPEEDKVEIVSITAKRDWGIKLTVTFNKPVPDISIENNVQITNIVGGPKLLTTKTMDGGISDTVYFTINDPGVKFPVGEHIVRFKVDGKLIEGRFTNDVEI